MGYMNVPSVFDVVSTTSPPGYSSRFGEFSKRLFDIFVSATGLLFLYPVFLYIGILIQRDSPGPMYYHGRRLGKGGKPFKILKFRTMHECPESYSGPHLTAQDDPRVTRLGRWLRLAKINELPQLWNVLKGDMSLVGPRPEDPEIAASWPDEVRREVLSVRPGITSPASVLYHDEEHLLNTSKVMDSYLGEILPSKLRLDQLYVRHRSFAGDLDILFRTLLLFIPRARSSTPPELSLFLGPINRLLNRHLSWFLIDTTITFIAFGLTGLVYRSITVLNVGWGLAIGLAACFAILHSAIGTLLGINRITWSRAAAVDAVDLIPGTVLATLAVLLFNYYCPASVLGISETGATTPWGTPALLPTGMILLAFGLTYIGLITVRYRTRLITGLATRWVNWRRQPPAAQERVLVVGGGETGQFAAWVLMNNHQYSDKLQVVGFVDDDLYKQDTRIHGVNVLGRRLDIPHLVARHDIGIIVYAIHNISAHEQKLLLEICANTPAQVVFFPDLLATIGGIVKNGNNTHNKTETLPCQLCLTKTSPLMVDSWLEQLEETVTSNDLNSVIIKIRELRCQLRGSIAQQLFVTEEKLQGSNTKE
jgi:lipopolysaccharide/colanic/teichoic acid biosynthesis glycosyltransferase